MSKVISTVHLFSLRVDRRGHIHMSASRNFFEVLRSRLGAAPGCTLRVGSFDFCQTRTSHFEGVPDEHSAAQMAEAQQLATRILTIYRSILLFEKVFAEKGSYENFVLFHRRAPQFKELQTLAAQRNLHVPFLELPFKANLQAEPVAVVAAITKTLEDRSKSKVVLSAPVAPGRRVLISLKKQPSEDKLSALVGRFSTHRQVRTHISNTRG